MWSGKKQMVWRKGLTQRAKDTGVWHRGRVHGDMGGCASWGTGVGEPRTKGWLFIRHLGLFLP